MRWFRRDPKNAIARIDATRSSRNPLITPKSAASLGGNLCGPSVIRAPGWIAEPPGRYYLYFGEHQGKVIHLATADAIDGPWTLFDRGVLEIGATGFRKSIAFPDVHADAGSRQVRMYFRGDGSSSVAFSPDGLRFEPTGEVVSRAYLRVFDWRGARYGICKEGDEGWGSLLRLAGRSFEPRKRFIRNMRHASVLVRGDNLLVFYTRVGDAPERIVAASVPLTEDWRSWRASPPVEVMKPEAEYEGAAFARLPSRYGPATGVNELRDPFVFDDGGRLRLFYSIAGESGIAVADLDVELAER